MVVVPPQGAPPAGNSTPTSMWSSAHPDVRRVHRVHYVFHFAKNLPPRTSVPGGQGARSAECGVRSAKCGKNPLADRVHLHARTAGVWVLEVALTFVTVVSLYVYFLSLVHVPYLVYREM